MSKTRENDEEFFPGPLVCQRYNVVDRTLNRWLAKQIFPPPDLVRNGRRYWRRSTIEAHERNSVAQNAA